MRTYGRIATAMAMAAAVGLGGCDAGSSVKIDEGGAESGKADSSVEASFLIFEFDSEVDYSWGSAEAAIKDSQLLYTIGHLNEQRSVGRLDNLELSNVKTSTLPSGKKHATYHAVLPVAWGSRTNLPTSYTFSLPRDITTFAAFTEKYKDKCIDHSAHEVDEGSMWYYFRPGACTLDDADVVRSVATVRPSTNVTTGKYPEYHKVWEDNALRVVSIFGKYEESGTTASDAGISAYNEFVAAVKRLGAVTSIPESVPANPGIAQPDIEFTLALPGGKTVVINALLVNSITSASAAFRTRYDQLSTRADLIAYNGHAGLGQNIRALAQWGSWTAGQYLILFSNGCDTYAYVDGSLADERHSINPDDPKGTKYLDFVVNAMPAYFHSDSAATMALIQGLMKFEAPKTYEDMFRNIDRSQVVLVTGEEDNSYVPGGGGTPSGSVWAGMNEKAEVAKGETLEFSTGEVGPGSFIISLKADPAKPTGDADLYVRTGAKPTSSQYDCRPYKDGSNEECRVTLAAKATIFIHVSGYSAASFILEGKQEGGAGPAPQWAGLDESATLSKGAEKRWEATSLPAGRYSFAMTGSGDADLYVKLGSQPTTSSYDCRPYENGSVEQCTVTLNETKTVHVMVRGYAASSTFRLIGKKL